jgi:hypothetical protein
MISLHPLSLSQRYFGKVVSVQLLDCLRRWEGAGCDARFRPSPIVASRNEMTEKQTMKSAAPFRSLGVIVAISFTMTACNAAREGKNGGQNA